MEIALVTEGTYPYAHGGVSVWCDQLIRGLPEYRFTVHAITGGSAEKSVWDAAPNVASVHPIPLWGLTNTRTSLRVARGQKFDFSRIHQSFLNALLHSSSTDAADFTKALYDMWMYSQSADLGAALTSTESIERLARAWVGRWLELDRTGRTPPLEPSLADAIEASDFLEHLLRPLTAPPPEADLVHAVSNGLSVLVALTAKWRFETPFVLTEHGVYLRERYLSFQTAPHSPPVKALILRFYRLLSSVGYRVADLITPGSDYNRRWELHCGAEANRIRRVYNGVDPSDFPQASFEPEHPTISWLGRVDPIKDVATLVRAFALVHDKMPNARLRLFGGTPAGGEDYRNHCQSLIDDLGLSSAAKLEGRVDSTVSAYHAGHIVALTSISEGFPYTVIEAMATGRPLVATDVGGVREAIDNTGFVVPPRNPEEVARACLTLLNDNELRHSMGVAARARALTSFALDSFLGVYRRLYHEVAEQASELLFFEDRPRTFMIDPTQPLEAV
jgi:polysaccharide biosynthesis protein PelF